MTEVEERTLTNQIVIMKALIFILRHVGLPKSAVFVEKVVEQELEFIGRKQKRQ